MVDGVTTQLNVITYNDIFRNRIIKYGAAAAKAAAVFVYKDKIAHTECDKQCFKPTTYTNLKKREKRC